MARKKISDEMKADIVERIFVGQSSRSICTELTIKRSALWTELKDDPLFEKNVRDARESFCHELASDLLVVADNCETMIDIQRARLKSENIRFVISKLAPRTFGDNIQVNVNHTLDLSRVLAAAAARVAPIRHLETPMIDVSPSVDDQLATGYEPDAEDFDGLL